MRTDSVQGRVRVVRHVRIVLCWLAIWMTAARPEPHFEMRSRYSRCRSMYAFMNEHSGTTRRPRDRT